MSKAPHDSVTSTIATFASSVTLGDLSENAIACVVRHHLDTVGCAIGGLPQAPSVVACNVARSALTSPGCSVFGIEETVAPEQAVFANGTMIRQMDFNDSYSHIGGGHPSDMIPAIFAAAELRGASGSDLIRSIYIAYEVFAGLAESYGTVAAGWDQGLFVALGSAIGAGAIFGLDEEGFANALSMAIVPAMSLRCTRSGELSNWKGSATAHSAMTGLFAARLAANGLTGPALPFEGADGFHRQVPPERDLVIGTWRGGLSAVERTSYKYFPAELHSQSIIEPLAAIRDQISVSDIAEISIETYHKSWYWIGGGYNDHEEKWHPKTRETADHSLPYVAAISLLDGDITHDSFSEQRIADPAVEALMQTITVSERSDLTAMWPEEVRTDVAIELRNGQRLDVKAGPPIGHPKNPMNDSHLQQKFNKLCRPVVGDTLTHELETLLWDLAVLRDLDGLSLNYRTLFELPKA